MAGDGHRFFLIRHGETDWNREFRYQGSSDTALNDTGLEQARRAAVRLSALAPARILASPLSRASRTAEVIASRSGVGVELLPALREISFGCWEGHTVPEIRAFDGETFDRWRRAPFSCAPEGGETLDEVMARARPLAEALAAESAPGGATFVVSHGGVLRALIAAMLGFGEADLLWRMRFDNCSITVIDAWDAYGASLLLTNDTHHLRAASDGRIARLAFPR